MGTLGITISGLEFVCWSMFAFSATPKQVEIRVLMASSLRHQMISYIAAGNCAKKGLGNNYQQVRGGRLNFAGFIEQEELILVYANTCNSNM